MQNNVKNPRMVKIYTINLCADARTVFPLLCPVKERDWIDGWDKISNVIYTESGIAEEGCVFETNKPTEGKAVWICSKYDLEKTKIEYIKHIVDKVIIKWTMEVKDVLKNKSELSATYIVTSLTDEGNQFMREFMEAAFPILMQGMEERINYYISTGKKS